MRRSRLSTVLARLSAVLLLAPVLTVSSGQGASASLVYECRASSISCISFSGYSGRSVWGYPVNSTGNNCTNYVAYRLARNGAKEQRGLGNGGSWAANARARGIRVDLTPKIGSIAQWGYGSAYAPGYGHVGYVEEVTASYITISDSSWSGGSYRWRVTKGDRNWPSAFIHFRDVAYQPPKSGSFVKVRESGEVYRLVGRTPVFVSTWTAFGGTKPTHQLAGTSLASLPAVPANGTFIKGAQTGEVYRVAGGAPVHVSTWAAFGGAKATMAVDQAAIDRAGTGGRWNHLRAVPAEGTLIKGAQRGEVYRVAGGAPVYVSAWANIGGVKPTVLVDQVAIDRAGSARKYNHLYRVPRNGSYLRGQTTGRVYQMSGGVAYHVRSWDQVGGTKPTTYVDQVAIDKAGTTSPIKWVHIRGTGTL